MIHGAPAHAWLVKTSPANNRWQLPRWAAVAIWSSFVAMWTLVGVLLVVSPDTVERLSSWVADQPEGFELAVWVLLLPVMIGIFVWSTSWALWVRLLVLAGCAAWTTIEFYPNRIAPTP